MGNTDSQDIIDNFRATIARFRLALIFSSCALLWPSWVMLSLLEMWEDIPDSALGFRTNLLPLAFAIGFCNITYGHYLWPLLCVFSDLLVACVGTWSTILACSVVLQLDPIANGKAAGRSGLYWLLNDDAPAMLITTLLIAACFCFLSSLVCSLCLFMQVPDESMVSEKSKEDVCFQFRPEQV